MAKYRKKPVVIDAALWEGVLTHGILDVLTCEFSTHDDGRLFIPTLEGEMTAGLGDWIVRGVKDECYPVKPDIFEATYEPVEAWIMRRLATALLAILLAGIVWALVQFFTADAADAASSVQTAVHLEVYPRVPYVRAAWTVDPGTTGRVTVSTWIAVVDCNTGRLVGTFGLSQLGGSNVGTATWYSHAMAVYPPKCLIPAGVVTDPAGHVLASSVGPRWRW